MSSHELHRVDRYCDELDRGSYVCEVGGRTGLADWLSELAQRTGMSISSMLHPRYRTCRFVFLPNHFIHQDHRPWYI
jgi:hypothetical protein